MVECPTLGFGSGHDPRVGGSSPTLASMLSVEPAWDSLSLSLSAPPLCVCVCVCVCVHAHAHVPMHALSLNKHFKKAKTREDAH